MSARRILLVDDDPDIRQIAALSLRRIGQFQVELAASGAEALAIVARDRPDFLPSRRVDARDGRARDADGSASGLPRGRACQSSSSPLRRAR